MKLYCRNHINICGKNCVCHKTYFTLKKWISLIKVNPLSIAYVFGILGGISLILGFFDDKGIFFTAAASAFAATAIMFTASCYQTDSKSNSSKFYLMNIRKYFQDSVAFLQNNNNDNIKWHQAINSLKVSENLYDRLTEESHIEIYLVDYINTAYSIIDVINSIDSYKFFYGLSDYQNKEDIELFKDCGAADANPYSTTRISPDLLHFLDCFMDIAKRIFHDTNKNDVSLLECSRQEYFQKITEKYELSPLHGGTYKIREYIRAYKKCEKEFDNHKTRLEKA